MSFSDYPTLCKSPLYVDKTLMIKTLLDSEPGVTLFTRPRRFGKSVNMSMVKTFFEKTDQDTSVYFKDKKIWECGEKYTQHQGKYPVIYLDLKEVEGETWEELYSIFYTVLKETVWKFAYLRTSPHCSEEWKGYLADISNGTANSSELTRVLIRLSMMLYEHHGVKPIIMIDEYDAPFQCGYKNGFYNRVAGFMKQLLSAALKGNEHITFGCLTGVLKIAQESSLSGLNNLFVDSVLSSKYSEYFGFTQEDVKRLVPADKLPEVHAWYNGYIFGSTPIYNPWSIINYVTNECTAASYWTHTGSDSIIAQIIQTKSDETRRDLASLLSGASIRSEVNLNIVYPELTEDSEDVYSLLLFAGYLTASDYNQSTETCTLRIPNNEIRAAYRSVVFKHVKQRAHKGIVHSLVHDFASGDSAKLMYRLEQFLLLSASYLDTASESFYHGLLLGICAAASSHYRVESNRESGSGRFDIQLMPRDKSFPGVIVEIKASAATSDEQLTLLSAKALEQIDEKRYDTSLRDQGVREILKYGMAFSGKNVRVAMRKDTIDHQAL